MRTGTKRTLRHPSGYLLSAQCKDRIWIGHTPDPEQTTTLIRQWCPFPIHDIEFRSMPADKVDQMLAAIVWDWDRLLSVEFGDGWRTFRDAWINNGDAPSFKVRLSRVFNQARQLTSERMADALGQGWMAM